jgi:hypothetical protein
MATLNVKVVPGASRSCIAGRLGDALKVRVAAAPEKGKANAAVIELLAEALGVKEAQIELVGGHTQPRKTFRISGMEQAQLEATLAKFQ